MDELRVAVYLPAEGKTYDVRIPRDVPLWKVTGAVGRLLFELSGGLVVPADSSQLCRRDGELLDPRRTAGELELCQGAALMLI